jgi:hypothetical protein
MNLTVTEANIIPFEDESPFVLDGFYQDFLNDHAIVEIAIEPEISSDVGEEEADIVSEEDSGNPSGFP